MAGITTSICYGSLHFGLPRALDLRAAGPLKGALVGALEGGRPIVIEAAAIERMSTACIQIIIAFIAAAQRLGLSVTIRRPSQAFVEAFNTLGLIDLSNNWHVET